METRLLLIRHAHIDTGARLCGSLDVPLSSAGRAQLEALLSRSAANPPPSALYSSTLRRAHDVAALLAHAWQLQLQPLDAVREIDCGSEEGVPLDQLKRHQPDLWARNKAQIDDDFAWPGGETYRQFRARIAAGLDAVAQRHPASRVAIVTHAGVVSQVLGLLRGRAAAAWEPDRPDPLSATEIIWADGAPRALCTFNDSRWY